MAAPAAPHQPDRHAEHLAASASASPTPAEEAPECTERPTYGNQAPAALFWRLGGMDHCQLDLTYFGPFLRALRALPQRFTANGQTDRSPSLGWTPASLLRRAFLGAATFAGSLPPE